MNWSSLGDFAAMGGYGLYVWGSFGITAIVMLGEMVSLRARRKALLEASRAVTEENSMNLDYREGAA